MLQSTHSPGTERLLLPQLLLLLLVYRQLALKHISLSQRANRTKELKRVKKAHLGQPLGASLEGAACQ